MQKGMKRKEDDKVMIRKEEEEVGIPNSLLQGHYYE